MPSHPPSAPNPFGSPVATGNDLLSRHAWLVFVLPLVVFLMGTQFEPKPDASEGFLGLPITYADYPLVYTLKIVATLAAVALVWRGYREFPWGVTPLAFVVGVVGVVVWVGACQLRLEEWAQENLFGPLGLNVVATGQRSAFNPLEQLADRPAWAYGFLAIRFVGLALVVPLIEEFFLRGFLLRFITAADWRRVPFGQVSRGALLAATIVPMLMHPGEFVAAMLWFSLVSWLMVTTRNIWDCVAAHATTNLLLGVYVVWRGADQPELWRLL